MSAVWPLNIAVADAIEQDPALRRLLAGSRVYNGRAPANSPRPYIVIGAPTEAYFTVFAREGWDGTIMLHLWSSEAGNREVSLLYHELFRVLSKRNLPLAKGYRMVRALLTLVEVIQDPDGGSHGVAAYETLTQQDA